MECSQSSSGDILSLSEVVTATVAIAVLLPLGRRARRRDAAQLGKLKDCIAEFGFLVPILIDEDGRIIAGNARVEAARLLGLTHVPAITVTHLTPEQKRAFVLADNRLAELASWDRETLKAEFSELVGMELSFDLAVTGFEPEVIDNLAFSTGDDTVSEAPIEPPAFPVSQAGDLWILGEHRLLCGDATCPTAVARLVDGELVRVIFTDPPYNVPVSGNVTRNKAHGEFVMASGEMSPQQFQAFLDLTLVRCSEALTLGGLLYVCMDWRHIGELIEAGDKADFERLNLLVWDKMVGGMGSFYRSRHELILLLRKPGASHVNRVALGRHGRDRHNVWAYEGVSGFGAEKAALRALHPTVKPLALIKDALLDCTERGDLVLDLFGGSGSTLLAAEVSRRRARLMELDPKYVDVCIRRWEDHSGKVAVLHETGETFSQVRERRGTEAED